MANKFNFYTRFNRPPQILARFDETMPSLTNQQFKDECNIDYIISHCTTDYLSDRLKLANSSMVFGAMLGDEQPLTYFTNLKDQENEFNHLPAKLRKEYGFNFKNFLKDVTSSDDGIKRAVDLGVLPKTFIKADVVQTDVTPDINNSVVNDVTEQVIKKED